MHKQGYVSLGLALCVALGVHSLIFLYLQQSKAKQTVKDLPIQVIILPQQAKSTVPTTQAKQKETKPILTTAKKSSLVQHASIPKKSSAIASQQQEKTVNKQQQHTNTVQMMPVPPHVQQVILSHIQYPRQARRRGLQGKAEFKLDINKQSIQQVTMLASTGYTSLDRAAKKGLTTIDSLPLDDGSYSLAVIFQIQ